MPVAILSRVADSQPVVRCLASRLVQDQRLAAGILAVSLATAVASAAWAAPQNKAQGKTVAAATATSDLNADGTVPDVITKAGAQTRVAVAFDCDQPDRAPILFARADHGTINVTEATGPRCGRPSMSLSLVLYTSEPGFKGTDKVYMLGYILNGNLNATYTVLVK
jgi:hypothetical protein